MRRLLLVTIAAIAIAAPTAARAQASSPASQARFARSSPTEIYEHGLKMMRRGYYTRALEDFNRVRNYHRDDPISVKAQLAIADVYYKKGDYEQARFAYEEFATYHPRHENLDYVTFRIGLSIYKRAPKAAGRDQTSTRSALNIWSGFDTRFPSSSYADEVAALVAEARDRLARKEFRIARFYRDRDAWGAVEGRAAGLVQRFPDSSYVPDALALVAEARHAWGDVPGARDARERLAATEATALLARVDRALDRPPGVRPRDEVFVRPYRVRGMGQPMPGAR